MAQTTSDLWKTLWRTRNVTKEYKFEINGVEYGPEEEIEHSYSNGVFEDFGIGNAYTASLTLKLFTDNIPRGATIKRYIRLRSGDQATEWLPKGTFFANTRADDDGLWTIEAYDSMRKAEAVWMPDQSLEFPLPMPAAAAEFARILGIPLDDRTVLNQAYTIDYPANDYTIRDELCFIAAAHAGNWIITDMNTLYLVPLMSAPAETHYLVEEHGDAITFGGVRILV